MLQDTEVRPACQLVGHAVHGSLPCGGAGWDQEAREHAEAQRVGVGRGLNANNKSTHSQPALLELAGFSEARGGVCTAAVCTGRA